MTKIKLNALEKVFKAEIEGAFNHVSRCYQSKAKIYKELEAERLVTWCTEQMRFKDGLPALSISIKGWQLTPLGHLTYCLLSSSSDDKTADK